MLRSKRLDALNKSIHFLIVKEKDVSEWNFSPELHSLLSQRKNLLDNITPRSHELVRSLNNYGGFE